MTLEEYQNEAMRTCTTGGALDPWTRVLGLCSEAGEVAGVLEKHYGQGHPLDREKALKELGDALWSIATASKVLGFTLEEVGRANVKKLRARYPQGFSPEASVARQDVGVEKVVVSGGES